MVDRLTVNAGVVHTTVTAANTVILISSDRLRLTAPVAGLIEPLLPPPGMIVWNWTMPWVV